MKQGLYEQIINNITKEHLLSLDADEFMIGKEPLDAEEAGKMLSNYAHWSYQALRSALRGEWILKSTAWHLHPA